MRDFLYKFIEWFSMALILAAAVECMDESTITPFIAPLIGIPLMLMFLFLIEYCQKIFRCNIHLGSLQRKICRS